MDRIDFAAGQTRIPGGLRAQAPTPHPTSYAAMRATIEAQAALIATLLEALATVERALAR